MYRPSDPEQYPAPLQQVMPSSAPERYLCTEIHLLSFDMNSQSLGAPASKCKVISPPGSVISVEKC